MRNQLRLLRAERSWSQAELAQRLGVSRQTVNAIETGKYDPSLPLAFQMADLFGLLIEEIFHPGADGAFAAKKRLEKEPREEEELVRAGRERLP
jgi:putative transcriptional regulator